MKACVFAAGVVVVVMAASLAAGEELVLANFDKDSGGITATQALEGSVVFSLETSGGGKFLSMEFNRLPKSTTAYVKLPIAKAIADNASKFDGITMKVRGDGSTTYGVIEMLNDEFQGRYQAVFPLTSKEWTTVAIRWEDFFANGDKSKAFMNPATAVGFAFGSRERWGGAKYAVNDIALAKIPARTPVAARPGADKLANLAAKVKEGRPVTIVGFGDSITVGTKVATANRANGLYFHYVARGIEKAFPGAKVSTVNAGVGGESFGRGIVRMGQDVVAPRPDLVIVLFGANDADGDHTVDRVRHELSVVIDHLLAETDADILILSPTLGAYKVELLDQYAVMYGELAAERGVAFFDLRAAQKALPQADQDRLLYSDNTHMVEFGHEKTGEMLSEYVLDTVKGAKAAPGEASTGSDVATGKAGDKGK